MSPRLSVVIPVKNCLPYLPKAIDSIRRQGIDNIEIVVIDDQSTDGLDHWLAQETERDQRLKSRLGPGEGVAAARNAGLDLCNAPLIAFLDADDSWNESAIADRLRLMEDRPEVVLTFADYEGYSPDGRRLGTYFKYWPRFYRWLAGRHGVFPLGDQAFDFLFAENVCGTSTVMARRDAIEAVGGFDRTLRICEDWDLWLKLSRKGPVWCSTTLTTRALDRPDSTSKNFPLLLACLERVIVANSPHASPWARTIARARLATVRAEVAEVAGRMPEAVWYRLNSFLLDPSHREARELLGAGYRALTRSPAAPSAHA
jgi:glycosyltransferase involved in cell wall biosynthesis